MKPKLSVITPFYNGMKFLEGFLHNIVEQTCLNDIEVLILDAGSTDGSSEILQEWAAQYPNIRHVVVENKLPVTETINRGIHYSRADLLSFWCVDDRKNAYSLESMIAYMNGHEDCDVLYGAVAWSYQPNETFNEANVFNLYPFGNVDISTMMSQNPPHCMPVWRKALHEKIGVFNPEFPTASDFEFWMRCLCADVSFHKFPQVVGLYYYNPDGLSTQSGSSNNEEAHIIRQKYFTLYHHGPDSTHT